MTCFEDRALQTEAVRRQFAEDCAEIFGGDAGARVLTRLCAGQHPLFHPPSLSEHLHGNAEVVAMLWRYASNQNTFPIETQNPQTSHEHATNAEAS